MKTTFQKQMVGALGVWLAAGLLSLVFAQTVAVTVSPSAPVKDALGRNALGCWADENALSARVVLYEANTDVRSIGPKGTPADRDATWVEERRMGINVHGSNPGKFSFSFVAKTNANYFIRVFDAYGKDCKLCLDSDYFTVSSKQADVSAVFTNSAWVDYSGWPLYYVQGEEYEGRPRQFDTDGDGVPDVMEQALGGKFSASDPNSYSDNWGDWFYAIFDGLDRDQDNPIVLTLSLPGEPEDPEEGGAGVQGIDPDLYIITWNTIPSIKYRLDYSPVMTDDTEWEEVWTGVAEPEETEISIDVSDFFEDEFPFGFFRAVAVLDEEFLKSLLGD